MLHRTMSVLGLFLVFAVSLAGWLVTSQVDAAYPHGTSYTIGLDLRQATATKEEVIEAFDDFAATRQINLIKVHSRWGAEHTIDEFIVFGDPAAVEGESGSQSHYLGSGEIDTRDLSGQYALNSCPNCAADFVRLTQELNAEIIWFETRDVPAVLRELAGSGTGLAYLALLALTLAYSVLWNSDMARSRSIRAVAGQSRLRILYVDLKEVVVAYGAPALFTAVLVTLVAFIFMTPAQAAVLTRIVWVGTLMTIGLLIVLNAWLISLTFNEAAIATREQATPVGLTGAAIGARFFALVLVLVTIPYSISVGENATSAMREAGRWSEAKSYVKVTNSTLVLEDEEGYIERFDPLVRSLGRVGSAAMSFSVDQMVEIPEATLAPFDHWIITDDGFLNAMHISKADLVELDWQTVPPLLQREITDNLEFWAADERLEYSLYSWEGEGSFPSLGSVAGDGNAVMAKHPIILVPDDPYEDFDPQLLLSPLVSNGQIVFANGAELQRHIDDVGLNPYVSSIDNLADQIADSARAYGQQAIMAAISLVFAVSTLLVIIVQSAKSWAAKNRRMIFAQLSSGRPAWSVALAPLAVEMSILVVATIATIVLSFAVLRIGSHRLFVALVVLVLCFVSAVILAYLRSITSSLQQSIHRRN